MKVQDLIALLKGCDPKADVVIGGEIVQSVVGQDARVRKHPLGSPDTVSFPVAHKCTDPIVRFCHWTELSDGSQALVPF